MVINKILLIDDQTVVLQALRLVLQSMGYQVVGNSDPVEAWNTLESEGAQYCDLVLSDLRMPELDGIGLLEKVKDKFPALPFIMMSGHATEQDVKDAEAAGMDGYLQKPFLPSELQAMIDAIIKAEEEENE